MDCGNTFTAEVTESGRIITGTYWGKLRLGGNRVWSRVIPPEERKPLSLWNRFWGRLFWWVDDEWSKCLYPWWERPFILLLDRFKDLWKKPKLAELWSCPDCNGKVSTETKKLERQ